MFGALFFLRRGKSSWTPDAKPSTKTNRIYENESQRASIMKTFQKYDTNADGLLDSKEIEALVKDIIGQLHMATIESDDSLVGVSSLYGDVASQEDKDAAAKVQQQISGDLASAQKSMLSFLDQDHNESIDIDEFFKGYSLWLSTKLDSVLGFGANAEIQAAKLRKEHKERREHAKATKMQLVNDRKAAAESARKIHELQTQIKHLQRVHAKELRKHRRESQVRLLFTKHDSNKDKKLDAGEITSMVTDLLSTVVHATVDPLVCLSVMLGTDPENKEAKAATDTTAAEIKANLSKAVESFVSSLDKDHNGAIDIEEFVSGYEKWVKTKLAAFADDHMGDGSYREHWTQEDAKK